MEPVIRLCLGPTCREGETLLLRANFRWDLSGGRASSALKFQMRPSTGGLVSPKIFWDQTRRKDAFLSTVEGSGTSMPAAWCTYQKCSSCVYSACPEQPAACAAPSQSRSQNSCNAVLFSWNVHERQNKSMAGNTWFLDSWPRTLTLRLGSRAAYA